MIKNNVMFVDFSTWTLKPKKSLASYVEWNIKKKKHEQSKPTKNHTRNKPQNRNHQKFVDVIQNGS